MERVDRIALVAAALTLVMYGIGGEYEQADPLHFFALAAGAGGLAAVLSHRRWAGSFVLVTVLALGVYLRLTAGAIAGSDVLPATSEALAVLGSGGNPYAHAYAQTVPAGGPFGYPPGELAFYGLLQLAGADLFRVDRACGLVGLGLIAYLAPLAGEGLASLALAMLATSPELVFHVSDGSNDTAAALLVLTGIVTLAWSGALRGRAASGFWYASAVAFGWAVAFKEYALPVAAFAAWFVWRAEAPRARSWIATAAGTVALFVVPFLAWNPAAFVANVGGALLVHADIWGRNVWHDVLTPAWPALGALPGPAIPAIALLAAAALTVALARRPPGSLGLAVLYGCAVTGTLFVLARWTTAVYYVFLAPVLAAGIALALGAEQAGGKTSGRGTDHPDGGRDGTADATAAPLPHGRA
jgi:hypothetical protein